MSLYYCGQRGCKGHHSFAETCSSVAKKVDDYAGLVPFIQGQWIGEDETQPVEPIKAEDAAKARGQVTEAMKTYQNKASLNVPHKVKSSK